MTKKIPTERQTQKRVIRLFMDELGYKYLGDWQYDRENSNIETAYLSNIFKVEGMPIIKLFWI